jgi:hypothetical protein
MGLYALLWGTQLAFPGNNVVGTIVVVITTILGVAIVRPGWNLGWYGSIGYPSLLMSLLIGSGAAAAVVLRVLNVPLPYELSNLKWIELSLSIASITALEELLFRQVMYRWLENQQLSGRVVVAATAIAFGCAHLGSVFAAGSGYRIFYLLQSAYLVLVGLLLGELRRATRSWLAPWLGHTAYNASVIFVLSIGFL